jgi:hypothetical protein
LNEEGEGKILREQVSDFFTGKRHDCNRPTNQEQNFIPDLVKITKFEGQYLINSASYFLGKNFTLA